MNDNNKIIPLQQNSIIPKVTNTLNITNKLIFENNQKLVMEIFERNPKLFIDLISEYYALNLELIEKHEDKFSWGRLSKNNFVIWSNSLLEKFEEKWWWYNLSINDSFKQFEELDEKYRGYLLFNATEVIDPPVIEEPWSLEYFEKHKNDYKWNYICSNISLPWSFEFIEKYMYEWNWLCLSRNKYLPFTVKLIHKYAEKWRSSESIWKTLQPYIDDEMMKEIFDKIDKQ